MNVLVTGSRGFVGRHLVRALAAAGHIGIATGRTRPEALPDGWLGAVRSDVLEGNTCATVPEVIVHLEVKHHVARPTHQDRNEFREVNVDGTRRWLAWAAARDVKKFVMASSVKAVKASENVADETAAPETGDPYGASKAEAEAHIRDWVLNQVSRSAVALRFPPIYGVGNTANLAAFTKQVLAGKPCLIGDGGARKSVVSVRNAVAGILHAITMQSAGYEVFNVCDSDPISLADLAGYIAEVGQAPIPRRVPYPAAFAVAIIGELVERSTGREAALDLRRLRTLTTDTEFSIKRLMATGFAHAECTRDGVRDMVEWLKNEPKPAA